MELRKLGNTGLLVSDLCLGTMNFGMPDWGVDEKASRDVIHAFIENGGNFIDTADVYSGGESERICGKALKGRRDDIILATKGHFPVVRVFGEPPQHVNALGSSRRHLTQALHDSLRRLETDYIDLYQVHCWDRHTPIEETLSTLDDFVRAGKVRYIGLSNFDAWQIAEARQLCIRHGWEPFITAQMQYSLVCRDIERAVTTVCDRYKIGLLPWSPLGGGILTGKYSRNGGTPDGSRFGSVDPDNEWRKAFLNDRNFDIAEACGDIALELKVSPATAAIAWVMQRRGVSSVIIGPKTVPQLKDNLAACDVHFNTEHLERLDRISRPPLGYPEKFIMRNQRNMFEPASLQ